MTVMNMFKG